MNLARHSISSARPVHILDARFDADATVFAASTHEGFAVYRSWPLELVRKRGMFEPIVSRPTAAFIFCCRTVQWNAISCLTSAHDQPSIPRRWGKESIIPPEQSGRLGRCTR